MPAQKTRVEAENNGTSEETASGDPGAVPRSEVSGKPKSLTYKGLKLRLPAKLPFRVLRFARNSDEMAGADIYGTLEAILGTDQMRLVEELDIDIDQGSELLEKVLERMGVGAGE